jgi:NTE family protein
VLSGDLLARIPLFTKVPRAALDGFAARFVSRRLDAGEYLFHAEDPADRLYVVGEGELEVVRLAPAGDAELLLNTLGRGALVGELAVLRGEARSASVRARGSALVYGVDSTAFIQLVHDWPQVAFEATRAIAEHLVRAERRLDATRTPVWAVVGRPDELAAFPAALLAAALPKLRTPRVVLLGAAPVGPPLPPGVEVQAAEPAGRAEAAQRAAAKAGLVVVLGTEAEVAPVLGVVSGVTGPGPRPAALREGVRHVELAARGAVSASRVRLGAGVPLEVSAGRVARILLGRSIGVALGGGMALGLAHLGVLEALEALRVPVDFIAGTSMGAMVGGVYAAAGMAGAWATALSAATPVEVMKKLDKSFFVTGSLAGEVIVRWLDGAMHGARHEQLAVPFAAVTQDLVTGNEVLLRTGRVVDGIRASISVPGLFRPYVFTPEGADRPGRFVDGGLVNNVPVDVARALGADRVIGSHVMGRSRGDATERGRWPRLARIPTLNSPLVVLQAQLAAHGYLGERQVLSADVSLLPDTRAFGFHEFYRPRELAEAGKRAVEAVRAELLALAD